MDYKKLYENVNGEFQSYQDFAEQKLIELTNLNKQLEKNLSIFTNVLEMSKYINLYMFNDNLIDKINDSIVGMLGVSYSTIHLFNGFSLEPKATNFNNLTISKIHYELELLKERKAFIINKRSKIFENDLKRDEIHSLIAVPIGINESFIGYIIVEHKYYAFFQKEDIKFLEYISNQVAMALTNRNLYNRIQEAAKRDVLLDIYNRKYFYDILIDRAKNQSKKGFSIVMADIDNFKKINDTYGHQVGDYALKHIVNIINFNLSEDDVVARYGGEEIIMLIEGDGKRATVIKNIEKMRYDIERFPLSLVDGRNINMTMSFGIANVDRVDEIKNIDNIIKIADENLYKAKGNGRNRVEY